MNPYAHLGYFETLVSDEQSQSVFIVSFDRNYTLKSLYRQSYNRVDKPSSICYYLLTK